MPNLIIHKDLIPPSVFSHWKEMLLKYDDFKVHANHISTTMTMDQFKTFLGKIKAFVPSDLDAMEKVASKNYMKLYTPNKVVGPQPQIRNYLKDKQKQIKLNHPSLPKPGKPKTKSLPI